MHIALHYVKPPGWEKDSNNNKGSDNIDNNKKANICRALF